jgi:LCP family protein required for cell wall assembly
VTSPSVGAHRPFTRQGTTIFETRKARWATGIAVAVVAVVVGGLAVLQAQLSGFERVDYDPDSAREALEIHRLEREGPVPEGAELEFEVERGDDLLTTLILGSDALDDSSARADAIMLVVLPPDDLKPVIASIPRDLWVENPCTGGMSRINAGLNGCGDEIPGPELMSIMVEDLAGIEIDHYAEVDFDGFIRIVDAFGGVEICTDHPVRDWRAELDLPGGCVTADGDDALAWARSRRTQELVEGSWRVMPGINALERDDRQQELALQVAGRIANFESPRELRTIASGLQDSVTLDSRLSVTRAVGLAWEYRGVDLDEVERITIPVSDHTTSGGAKVVRPEASLRDLLAEALDKEPADLANDQ